MDDLPEVPGSEMKMLLVAAGLTQADFAREIDASVACVNGWCAGRVGKGKRKALAYRLACMILRGRAKPE